MGEPISSAIGGGVVASKIFSGLSGLFGGITLTLFWQSKRLQSYSKFIAGAITGSVSVTAAISLTGILASYLNLASTNLDVALGIGYLVGMLSVGVVTLLANFFDKREDKDLLEVVKEVTDTKAHVEKTVPNREGKKDGPHNRRTTDKPVRRVPK